MKVKVESDKVGLKLNIQKTKIMASGPITSWEIDGETVETVSDFFFFLILNFYIYFILLYSTVLVVPHIDMNPPWVHIFGAPKSLQMVTAAMKFKKCLLLGRKFMTNLDSILKSRDITLSTKVCLVKAMVFPVVMYGCESWTVKKAEGQRIDTFELCV